MAANTLVIRIFEEKGTAHMALPCSNSETVVEFTAKVLAKLQKQRRTELTGGAQYYKLVHFNDQRELSKPLLLDNLSTSTHDATHRQLRLVCTKPGEPPLSFSSVEEVLGKSPLQPQSPNRRSLNALTPVRPALPSMVRPPAPGSERATSPSAAGQHKKSGSAHLVGAVRPLSPRPGSPEPPPPPPGAPPESIHAVRGVSVAARPAGGGGGGESADDEPPPPPPDAPASPVAGMSATAAAAASDNDHDRPTPLPSLTANPTLTPVNLAHLLPLPSNAHHRKRTSSGGSNSNATANATAAQRNANANANASGGLSTPSLMRGDSKIDDFPTTDANDLLANNMQGRVWRQQFNDFLSTCHRLGQTIVEELHIPYKEKTLKPMRDETRRYFVEGIVFEVVDGDGEQAAMEALIGLSVFRRCFVSLEASILVPAVAMIDVRGKRLVAVAADPSQQVKAQHVGSELSALQALFFRVTIAFTYDNPPKSITDEETKKLSEKFPTDASILRFMLQEVLVHKLCDTGKNKRVMVMYGDFLATQEFIRTVTTVFPTDDVVAHGYAVRVLWGVLVLQNPAKVAERLAFYATEHFSALRMTAPVKNAMFALLLSNPEAICTDLDIEYKVGFYVPVVSPSIWSGLFAALPRSDYFIRRLVFEDINTVLHDSFANVKSFCEWDNWQTAVFESLLDVPKVHSHEPLKSLFGFQINTITNVHFEFFKHEHKFDDVFIDTVTKLATFSGWNSESQLVATLFFNTLTQKLTSRASKFPPNTSTPILPIWANLLKLSEMVKKFVFQTAWWQAVRKKGSFDAAALASVSATPLASPKRTESRRSVTPTPGKTGAPPASTREILHSSNAPAQRATTFTSSSSASSAQPAANRPSRLSNFAGPASPPAHALIPTSLLSTPNARRKDTVAPPLPAPPSAFGGPAPPMEAPPPPAKLTPDLLHAMAMQSVQDQAGYVLKRGRLERNDKRRLPFSKDHTRDPTLEKDMTEFGLHWAHADETTTNVREGDCADVNLVYNMLALFRALHLDNFDPSLHQLSSGGGGLDDKPLLLFGFQAFQAFQFWEEALVFVSTVKRKAIDDHQLLTYRKLSHLTEKLLTAKTDDVRKSVNAELLAINSSA